MPHSPYDFHGPASFHRSGSSWEKKRTRFKNSDNENIVKLSLILYTCKWFLILLFNN